MITRFRENAIDHEKALVSSLWNDPSLYEKIVNNRLTRKSFVQDIAYVFYQIGKRMHDEGINNFDDITIESFLKKNPKSSSHFEKAGGYNALGKIQDTYEPEMDYNHSLDELLKYSSLRELNKKGIIDEENDDFINKLCKANLEQSKKLLAYVFEEAYSSIDRGLYKEVDLTGSLMTETVGEIKEGYSVGMKIYNAPTLTRKMKGFARGRLVYLGMQSGVGKSTMLRNMFLQSIIDSDEKCVVLINEESIRDWVTNITISIANNRLNKLKGNTALMVEKDDIFAGDFQKNDESKMNSAIKWFEKNYSGNIKLIALQKYRFQDISKILTKYSKLGYGYVLFDTFKPDGEGIKDRQRWEQFSTMSRELYDLIKEENLNMGTVATVQLAISKKNRFLTKDNIGKSREIVEVANIILLGRKLFSDEYPPTDEDEMSGKNELLIKDVDGNRVTLDNDKEYVILYFGKNRVGSEKDQIVFEMDYDHNTLQEIGICSMREEF